MNVSTEFTSVRSSHTIYLHTDIQQIFLMCVFHILYSWALLFLQPKEAIFESSNNLATQKLWTLTTEANVLDLRKTPSCNRPIIQRVPQQLLQETKPFLPSLYQDQGNDV
jgi:hypothetical protein